MTTQADLDGKKRWIRTALDGSRAADAQNKIQDFEKAFNAAKPQLAPAYVQDTEAYIVGLHKELETKTIKEEYGPKVNAWRSQLRRVQSNADDFQVGRGSCSAERDFNQVVQQVEAAAANPSLLVCDDLKTFLDEWKASLKAIVQGKVDDLNKRVAWFEHCAKVENWVRPLERDIRNCNESPSKRNADQMQKTAESVKEALEKIDRAKWSSYPPALAFLAKIDQLIVDAYAAMERCDNATAGKAVAQAARAQDDINEIIAGCSSDIAAALRANTCTYSVTKSSFRRQPNYSCNTCGNGYGVCVTCKNHCHPADHRYSELLTSEFYCDCGHSGKCKWLNQSAPAAPAATRAAAAAATAAPALTCRKGHELKKTTNRSCRCDECSASVSESMQCGPCDYDMCMPCVAKRTPAVQPTAATAVQPASALTTTARPAGASTTTYQTSTFECWIPGDERRPVGCFDCSSRQCTLKVRDALTSWRTWADYFNQPWEEVLKYRAQMNERKADADWAYNNIVRSLDSAESHIKNMRTCAEQIAAAVPGGASHPAVVEVTKQREQCIARIRDMREAVEREHAALKFASKVESLLANAKTAIEVGHRSKDFVNGVISIDSPYSGENYRFPGMSSGYRNCDVFRVALGELAKARNELKANPTHPLAATIPPLEHDAKQAHEELCLRWALKNAEDGCMEKAQEYREACVAVTGITPAVNELDRKLAALADAAAKKRAEDEAKAKVEAERHAKEEAEAHCKLLAQWFEPYRAGGKIYCDEEVWTFDGEKAVCSDGRTSYEWTGASLSGSMSGSGTWTGYSFNWWFNSRYTYSYNFDGKSFVPSEDRAGVLPTWKWDGTLLMPQNDGWKSRMVRYDGKVPVPLLLAIAMRVFCDRRMIELNGDNLCKSGLFGEGTVGKTCDNCSRNYAVKCAVCGDGIPFPRNPALLCKYCINRSGCMKCGYVSANNAAFVCDTCQFKFSTQCVKNTR